MNVTRLDGDPPQWLTTACAEALGAGVRAATIPSPDEASGVRARATTAFLKATVLLGPPSSLLNLWLYAGVAVRVHLQGAIADVVMVDARDKPITTVGNPRIDGILTASRFIAHVTRGEEEGAVEIYGDLWGAPEPDGSVNDHAATAVFAGTVHMLAVAGEVIANAHAEDLPAPLLAGRDQVLAHRRDGTDYPTPRRGLWDRLRTLGRNTNA